MHRKELLLTSTPLPPQLPFYIYLSTTLFQNLLLARTGSTLDDDGDLFLLSAINIDDRCDDWYGINNDWCGFLSDNSLGLCLLDLIRQLTF
jgi:hypothetical protein